MQQLKNDSLLFHLVLSAFFEKSEKAYTEKQRRSRELQPLLCFVVILKVPAAFAGWNLEQSSRRSAAIAHVRDHQGAC
jgi:hypothetical protein